MLFTSPRITALNQILHSSPIITSPTIVAFGAIKQSLPVTGIIPLTGRIKPIDLFFDAEVEDAKTTLCGTASLRLS
jgi:hypothetical protein